MPSLRKRESIGMEVDSRPTPTPPLSRGQARQTFRGNDNDEARALIASYALLPNIKCQIVHVKGAQFRLRAKCKPAWDLSKQAGGRPRKSSAGLPCAALSTTKPVLPPASRQSPSTICSIADVTPLAEIASSA